MNTFPRIRPFWYCLMWPFSMCSLTISCWTSPAFSIYFLNMFLTIIRFSIINSKVKNIKKINIYAFPPNPLFYC
jgi:hypothetical protein